MNKQVCVISLGCPKNLVDSEVILGLLGTQGYQLTQFPESADIVIINTCSFIESARAETKATINKFCKRSGYTLVCGCLPQLHGAKLFKEFPGINAILGSADFYKLPKVITRLLNGEDKIIEISPHPTFICSSKHPRLVSTMPSYAYLKIAEGCSNHCSYCKIPFIRGEYRSREITDIVDEAHKLVNLGIKEIILVAQDTTRFGASLCKLLKELDKIENLYWLRLLYTHPAHFTDKLIDVLNSSEKICKYIDLPIQHTHSEILKQMNRPLWEPTKELLYKLKEQGFTLRTTVLVGFPGEKDKHFEKLLNDIKEIEFDWLGAFAYSNELDTPASLLPDKVPAKIKQERLNLLMEAQREIVLKKNLNMIGKTLTVLVDTKGAGHTESQCPEIDGKVLCSTEFKAGEIFTGKVKKVVDVYDIYVEPV